MKSIFICGLPGCGKTYFGQLLAQHLGVQWVDVDQLLEKTVFHQSISSYVQKYGWEAFREEEASLVQELSSTENQQIVSLGGGSLEDLTSLEQILHRNLLVYLKANPTEIRSNLGPEEIESRPMFKGKSSEQIEAHVKELLLSRRGKYEQSHVITGLESVQNLDLFTKRLHLFTSTPRKH